MKNLSKKVVMLALVAMLLFSMAIPAHAAYTWSMDVGESFKLNFTDTPYISSNPAVVEIQCDSTGRYLAVAVGEGTAIVSGGTWMDKSHPDYEFTVTDPQNFNINALPIAGIGTIFAGGFLVFGLIFLGAIALIAFGWKLVFSSLKKSRKLDDAMHKLAANPCQQTAEVAAAEFSNMKGLVRFNLASGGNKSGVHFDLWRDVFNRTVIPCRTIKTETKIALRQALVNLNTYGLLDVIPTQTPEEANEAAEAFGRGGEDNVWHNLKSLQGCDVYRNVRISNGYTTSSNGCTTSEIDAVIVDANKGIFLIETKSIGGMRANDGNKVVAFNMLKQEPSNQIYRHEYDFTTYFAGLGIENKIKNVLVFSWPHNEESRHLDRSTLPQTDYDIITVEGLMRYHRMQPANPLSEQQRNILAEKLKSCSSEYIIR